MAILSGAFLARVHAREMVGKAVTMVVLVFLCALTWYWERPWASNLALWKNAVRRFPGHVVTQNNLAAALRDQGRTAAAERAYIEGLRFQTQDVKAVRNLATMSWEEGDEATAWVLISHFSPRRRKACYVYLTRGDFASQRKRWQEASCHYLQAISVDPFVDEGYGRLGTCQIMQGQLEMAARVVDRGLSACPLSPYLMKVKGKLCLQGGARNEAFRYFARALQLAPDDPEGGLLREFMAQGAAR